MKRTTAYLLGLMFAGVLVSAGIASAFGAGFANDGQSSAIRQAVENNDFEAWKTAMEETMTQENFDKLVDLVELEQKTQRLFQEQLQLEKERKQRLEEKPEFGSGFEAGVPKKKIEEVKAIVAEVQKHRIITDFDNVLELVQRKGKVSGDDALKELKISRNKLKECISVLEQNSLLRVDFPPIGPEILYDINYVQPAKPSKENSKK